MLSTVLGGERGAGGLFYIDIPFPQFCLFLFLLFLLQCLAESGAQVAFYMDIQQFRWEVGKHGYLNGIQVLFYKLFFYVIFFFVISFFYVALCSLTCFSTKKTTLNAIEVAVFPNLISVCLCVCVYVTLSLFSLV